MLLISISSRFNAYPTYLLGWNNVHTLIRSSSDCCLNEARGRGVPPLATRPAIIQI